MDSNIAAWGFEVFLILASGNLVSEDVYSTILTNTYLVLGIGMLFVVAFSLLKLMINPESDKKGASGAGKILINLLTSALMIVLLPVVFTALFNCQDSIIVRQNTIGKFFNYGGLSYEGEENSYDEIRAGSYKIVNGVFTAFFNADPDYCVDEEGFDVSLEPDDILDCKSFAQAELMIAKY